MTRSVLLDRINIPEQIFTGIRGESLPEKEAIRYSTEIKKTARSGDNLPVFDLIILGLGDDGHTASIFPRNRELLFSGKDLRSCHPPCKPARKG